jgi:hypothetical protein
MPKSQITRKKLEKRAEKAAGLSPLPARMGKADGSVFVPGKSYTVWITYLDGATVEAINMRVPNRWGQMVLVGYDPLHFPNRRQVLSLWDVYPDAQWMGTIDHAATHQWPAHDAAYMREEQLAPGLVVPVSGQLKVKVYPSLPYRGAAAWKVYRSEQTVDFSASVPASGARVALLVVDGSGVLTLRNGAIAATKGALTDASIPLPLVGDCALAGLILYAGMTQAAKNGSTNDIIDLRFTASGFNHAHPNVVFTVQTGAHTVAADEQETFFTGSSPATFSLPAATGTGHRWRGINEGSAALTIDGNGSDTIKNSLTQVLYPGEDLIVTDYAVGKWA